MRLDTYAKLKKWIETNVPKSKRGDAKTTADAAIWFVCWQEAHSLHDMSQRDMARLVSDGLKPTNTTKHVDEWLATVYEGWDTDEDIAEATKSLKNDLRNHFGI
jgi:hypothetical protein